MDEGVAGEDPDVGLVGEEPIDAGVQIGGDFVQDAPVVGRVGAAAVVGGQGLLLRAQRVGVDQQPRGVRVGDQGGGCAEVAGAVPADDLGLVRSYAVDGFGEHGQAGRGGQVGVAAGVAGAGQVERRAGG